MLVINNYDELHEDYNKYYIYKVTTKTLPYFINEIKEQQIKYSSLVSVKKNIEFFGFAYCFIIVLRKGSTPSLEAYYNNLRCTTAHLYKPKLQLKYNKPSLGGSTIQK